MNCPRCRSERTRVVNTYDLKKRPTRRRLMKCMACDERFVTNEDYSDRTLEEVKIYKKKTKPYTLTVGFEGMEEVLARHKNRAEREEHDGC